MGLKGSQMADGSVVCWVVTNKILCLFFLKKTKHNGELLISFQHCIWKLIHSYKQMQIVAWTGVNSSRLHLADWNTKSASSRNVKCKIFIMGPIGDWWSNIIWQSPVRFFFGSKIDLSPAGLMHHEKKHSPQCWEIWIITSILSSYVPLQHITFRKLLSCKEWH